MISFGLLSLVAGGVMIWLGGPVGWVVGGIYVLSGIDLLWFQVHKAWLYRKAGL